jgi:hypothetical protein
MNDEHIKKIDESVRKADLDRREEAELRAQLAAAEARARQAEQALEIERGIAADNDRRGTVWQEEAERLRIEVAETRAAYLPSKMHAAREALIQGARQAGIEEGRREGWSEGAASLAKRIQEAIMDSESMEQAGHAVAKLVPAPAADAAFWLAISPPKGPEPDPAHVEHLKQEWADGMDDTVRPAMSVISPEGIDAALAEPVVLFDEDGAATAVVTEPAYVPKVGDRVVVEEADAMIHTDEWAAACKGATGTVTNTGYDGTAVNLDGGRWVFATKVRPTSDEPGEEE